MLQRWVPFIILPSLLTLEIMILLDLILFIWNPILQPQLLMGQSPWWPTSSLGYHYSLMCTRPTDDVFVKPFFLSLSCHFPANRSTSRMCWSISSLNLTWCKTTWGFYDIIMLSKIEQLYIFISCWYVHSNLFLSPGLKALVFHDTCTLLFDFVLRKLM